MDYLIQKYLTENNLTGVNGIDYILQDNGNGTYIKEWKLNIAQPTFTSADYEISTLEQAKLVKIAQLKANRNAALEKTWIASKAKEWETENQVYFEFSLKSTGIVLTEPHTIVFGALLSVEPIKYSCKIIEGENRREGYIILNQEVAQKLSSHFRSDATGYIGLANDLEAEINACTTIKQINLINIEF